MTAITKFMVASSLATIAVSAAAQDVVMRRPLPSASTTQSAGTTPTPTPTPTSTTPTPTPTPVQPQTSDWIPCATENGYCVTTDNANVRYGDGDTYVYKSVQLGVSCSNGVFGDPKPNVVKHCDYQAETATPTPTPTPPLSPMSVPSTSDDVAQNVRTFGQDVYDLSARTLKVPETLADLPGLPTPQFGSGATLLGEGDVFQAQGGNSYVFRMQVNDRVACGLIDGAVGGNSAPGGSPSIDQTRPEGCGDYYGNLIYWKRIDGAQAQAQAGYLRSIARAASAQAATTIGSQPGPTMPTSYGDANFPTPNVYNLSDDRGHPYDATLGPNILHVMRVHYRDVCSAINVATGGQDNVDGSVPSDFSRAEGCSGYYGDMYYWLNTGAIAHALGSKVRQMSASVVSAVGATPALPTSYAAIGMTEPPLGNEVADTGFVQQGDEMIWYADVNHAAVCSDLAQGAGMSGIASSVNYDNPEGCGYYYNSMRYWKHIEGAALPREMALIESYMHQVRAAALAAKSPWTSISDLGVQPPDFQGLADLGAAGNGFTNIEGNDVYVINLHSQALCSALSAANGGPQSVNGGYDTGWNRAEGCSGYYGNVWYYIQMPPQPASLTVNSN